MTIGLLRARVRDATRLSAFHNTAYGESRTEDQWLWQFGHTTLPDGTLPFVVAKLGGRVVGTQARIPIRAVSESGDFLTGKFEEILLALGCRGQGVFDRMYDLLCKIAQEMGISYDLRLRAGRAGVCPGRFRDPHEDQAAPEALSAIRSVRRDGRKGWPDAPNWSRRRRRTWCLGVEH
jgi:hypothetical protein